MSCDCAATARPYWSQRFDGIEDEQWQLCARIKILRPINFLCMEDWVRAKITARVIAVAIACGVMSLVVWSGIQWGFQRDPLDFEQCSEQADRNARSEDNRKSLVAQCDKRFVGRRKIGGGYTYYDFLQNRHFDIAGPNPSPEELKYFDEQYASYLDAQRRDIIAASLAEKNSQRTQTAFEDNRSTASTLPGSPLQIAPTNIPIPIARNSVIRSKGQCNDPSLSCRWTKLSAGLKSFFESNAKLSRP